MRTVAILSGALLCVLSARADDIKVEPVEFAGKAGDCGTLAGGGRYPAGSRIVTAAWLEGLGLPDSGGPNSNASNPADNPNKQDSRWGLLLSKNGPTPDCSSAQARITGVEGMVLTEVGFDFRNGSHCGAGAPRFNAVLRTGSTETFHFLGGCANGTKTPAPQDPAEWTRVRINPSSAGQAFPVAPPGARIRSLTILYDEGVDSVSGEDPKGVGLAILDNIAINGIIVGKGSKGRDKEKDNDDDDDDDDED